MFTRVIPLSLAAMIAVGAMAASASADPSRGDVTEEDDFNPGLPILRDIPGLRIFFGDYALSEEEFDQLYGRPRRVYREDNVDPEPPNRRRPAMEQDAPQPKKTKPAAKAAKPAERPASASKNSPASQVAAGLSCEKALSVVSGYGFSSVSATSCTGKVYAFNATRDGKNFAIKLNPATGQLTNVKKLP